MSNHLKVHTMKAAPSVDLTIDPRVGLVPSTDSTAPVPDAKSYALRAAKRAAFAAYALALDGGQTQRESFAAALSAWRKFRPEDSDFEAHETVVPIVLAVLDLDETGREWLPS
jgi:hypothetical protein